MMVIKFPLFFFTKKGAVASVGAYQFETEGETRSNSSFFSYIAKYNMQRLMTVGSVLFFVSRYNPLDVCISLSLF